MSIAIVQSHVIIVSAFWAFVWTWGEGDLDLNLGLTIFWKVTFTSYLY